MVLRAREGHGVEPVTEGEERHLLALKKLLDNQFSAVGSERRHERVDSGVRFDRRIGHNYALSRRKPVRLDHDRRPALMNIGLRFIWIAKPSVTSGRDAEF